MAASGSALMATMVLAPLIPATCWVAPEMPTAIYRSGLTVLPAWPTCIDEGTQPASVAARAPAQNPDVCRGRIQCTPDRDLLPFPLPHGSSGIEGPGLQRDHDGKALGNDDRRRLAPVHGACEARHLFGALDVDLDHVRDDACLEAKGEASGEVPAQRGSGEEAHLGAGGLGDPLESQQVEIRLVFLH